MQGPPDALNNYETSLNGDSPTRLARQIQVQQIYIRGEALSVLSAEALKIFVPGTEIAIDPKARGSFTTVPNTNWTGARQATDLHSITLLNAFEQTPDFLAAAQQHPELLGRVFSGLFNENPSVGSADFLDLMVRRQLAGEGSLTTLAADVGKINLSAGLSSATSPGAGSIAS